MKLEGSFVALVTPFNIDGSVDFGAFRTLIQMQGDHGTRALFFMGTAGESSVLSVEEKKRLIVETARMKIDRIAFFYGCTGVNTDDTIERVKFAKANGADGAMLTVPVYVSPPESDAEAYFLEVADATDLPLGIYNNASRLQTDMHWTQLLRIFRHPNYVVHKESTTRAGQIAHILRAAPDISVMCDDTPDPGLIVPTMALGGHGISNAVGNIAPAEIAALAAPWKMDTAASVFRALYLRMLPLLGFTYSARSPVAIKSLMRAVGLPAGDLRRPLRNLDAARVAEGAQIIRELGLDAKYGYKLSAT